MASFTNYYQLTNSLIMRLQNMTFFPQVISYIFRKSASSVCLCSTATTCVYPYTLYIENKLVYVTR